MADLSTRGVWIHGRYGGEMGWELLGAYSSRVRAFAVAAVGEFVAEVRLNQTDAIYDSWLIGPRGLEPGPFGDSGDVVTLMQSGAGIGSA